jgi:hypothetical protein
MFSAPIASISASSSRNAHVLRLFFDRHREHRLQNRHAQHSLPVCIIAESEGWIRMDIRFVSSLTSEDEKLFAPALLKAVAALLDQLPIAYTVRIETTGAEVFQHAHAGAADEPAKATKPDLFESPGDTGNGRAMGYLGRLAQ